MSEVRSNSGLIAWFAHNHVAANLLMLFIVLTGLYGVYFGVTTETFPNVEFDSIVVRVPYLGAAPEEVEEGVIVKVEEAIEDIEGIKEVQSTAFEGMGSITIELQDEYDLGTAMDEVKLAVDAISTFPGETERPIISKSRFRRGALTVQVSGSLSEHAMKELADDIRDEIVALEAVTYAEVWGARPFEISIEVPENTLRQYGLTLDDVARSIRAWSLDLPGGNIRTGTGDIRLRTKGQAYTGADFADIVLLTRPDGTRLTVADIATIRDGFVESDSYALFNGEPSFGIAVFATDADNELEVAAAARDYVEARRATLPDGVQLNSWADNTYYLQGRLDMMIKNMLLGAALVFVILTLFLHLKIALWVLVGLPIAFLGAFMLMPVLDVSVNVLSLFGLILVLGIVVDDAIVIAEAVHSETEEHGYTLENIIAGAQRVATPATFGVLTAIMAFLPMVLTTGPIAAMTGAIGWVVILCLAFSLVESKLVLPSHLAIMRSSHDRKGMADRTEGLLKVVVEKYYQPLLARAIEFRYLTLASFIALLFLAVGLVGGGLVRFTFFPEMGSDYLNASVSLHQGAPEHRAREIVEHMSNALANVNDGLTAETTDSSAPVQHVFAFVNDGTSGRFQVELSKSENRSISPQDIEARWREAVGEIPDAKSLKFESSMHTGGGPPIAFKISGVDYTLVDQAASDIVRYLENLDGVFEVESSADAGPNEIRLQIKPEAQPLGVTLADLARQVRAAFYGAEAQRIQRGDDEVKVMVRYPRHERQSVENLENMWIRTPDGRELPFHTVASFELDRGFSSIQRINGDRSISITARSDAAVAEPASVSRKVLTELKPKLEARYPGVKVALTGAGLEAETGMTQMLLGFGLALFGIYALMAIPLKSYIQPLVIMGVIPFGIVGAVFGHWLLDIAISSISMFGIIALSGVVVNDSLIMVDFVNKAVARGESPFEAALHSGSRRFRAIMLTSLTTFFGLVPMLLETSLQAQIVMPMAVSMAFGILFATFITLVLVPALYMVAGDLRSRLWPVRTPSTSSASGST